VEIADLELVPSHFVLAEGETEVWASVFRSLREWGGKIPFTYHHTSSVTNPATLAAELAEAIRSVRSTTEFRVDPVLPVCVICSRQPNQIVAASLELLSKQLLEHLRFRLDWFTVASEDGEVRPWRDFLSELRSCGELKACSVYLLSRHFGKVRLGERECKRVLARLICLFALTARSRLKTGGTFERFRFSDGFHARIVGLEVFSISDIEQTARRLIDREIWARMWPEMSENLRATVRNWLAQDNPDPLMPLLRLAAASVTLDGLAHELIPSPTQPLENLKLTRLALEIRRAVANEKNFREASAALRTASLPIENVFDVEAGCLSDVASTADRIIEEYPLPVLLYMEPQWPEAASIRSRLRAAHARAVSAIVTEIYTKFPEWARSLQNEWFQPNQSARESLNVVIDHLHCSSSVTQAKEAEVFTFVAPEFDRDLREELTRLPGCVSHLYAVEVDRSNADA
jgi:hypothetical protein